MAFFAKLQSSVSGTGQVPIGTILPRNNLTVPKGWLRCNGGTFSSTLYPELARVLGNTYGASSGTTYYLPDTQERVLIGAGQGSGLTNRVLGTQLGAKTVTLTALQSGSPIHSHVDTATNSAHSHTTGISSAGVGGVGAVQTPALTSSATLTTGNRNPNPQPFTYTLVAESSAATDSHDNIQPTTFYLFMIRAI